MTALFLKEPFAAAFGKKIQQFGRECCHFACTSFGSTFALLSSIRCPGVSQVSTFGIFWATHTWIFVQLCRMEIVFVLYRFTKNHTFFPKSKMAYGAWTLKKPIQLTRYDRIPNRPTDPIHTPRIPTRTILVFLRSCLAL